MKLKTRNNGYLLLNKNIGLIGKHQKNRGKLNWYNPYIPYRTNEIWPNQSTSIRAGNETTDVMVLRYKSKIHHFISKV